MAHQSSAMPLLPAAATATSRPVLNRRPLLVRGGAGRRLPMDAARSTTFDISRPLYRGLPATGGPAVARPSMVARPMMARARSYDPFQKPVYRSLSLSAAPPAAAAPTYRSLSMVAPAASAGKAPPASTDFFASGAFANQPKSAAAPSVVVISSSAAALPLCPPQLPPLPFALERHTTVKTQHRAEHVVSSLRAALAAAGAAVEWNAAKCKFKCTAYGASSYNAVSFRVRLYRGAGDELQVEFQRRSGCCMAWLALYDDLMLRLDLDEAAAVEARARVARRTARVARVAAPVDGAASPADDNGSLDAVAEMCASGYSDAQLEACRSLAQLTARGPAARAVARHAACLSETLGLLRSEDGDVQRCAVAAVANVCAEMSAAGDAGDAVAQLRRGAVGPLVDAVAATTPRRGGHLAETRRHAVRALAALARASPEAVADIASTIAATPAAVGQMRRLVDAAAAAPAARPLLISPDAQKVVHVNADWGSASSPGRSAADAAALLALRC